MQIEMLAEPKHVLADAKPTLETGVQTDQPIRMKQTQTRCTPKICAVLIALRKASSTTEKNQVPDLRFAFRILIFTN